MLTRDKNVSCSRLIWPTLCESNSALLGTETDYHNDHHEHEYPVTGPAVKLEMMQRVRLRREVNLIANKLCG